MLRRVFDVVAEPTGSLLKALFTFLGQQSTSMSVALRDELGLARNGQDLLARLDRQLIDRRRSSSWPGTTLIGHEATVLQFAIDPGVLAALAAAADGLYGWRQPMLPEDLAFLRSDGTVMFASICHEQDAFLEITDEEHQSLIRSLPEITTSLRARDR